MQFEKKDFGLFSDGKNNVSLKHDTKIPILLPRNNYSAVLLLNNIYCLVLHNYIGGVLPELSMCFWICSEIKFVRSVIQNFYICELILGTTYKHLLPAL